MPKRESQLRIINERQNRYALFNKTRSLKKKQRNETRVISMEKDTR